MSDNKVSSGIENLDKLINYLNIGDNVIWHVETGAFVELYCRAFVAASLKDGKDVIFVNFNTSPRNVMAKMGDIINNEKVTVIDCFTSGKGENSKLFLDLYKTAYKKYKCNIVRVDKPSDVTNFINEINKIEESHPRARYVFDSLTGMMDLWGSAESALKFFTRQCPRLYELDTIAYWIVEKNAHSEEFRAQINHITQVVIDISIDDGVCNLMIVKAENRFGPEILKPHSYEVINSNIEFLEKSGEDPVNIGGRVREIRQRKEISQAQLAADAGVTPSTISQLEKNAIKLSLPALFRLTRALNISMGALLDERPSQPSQFMLRAKNRALSVDTDNRKFKGVITSSVIPQNSANKMEAYVIEFAPGVKIDSHFFSYKGNEFGFVLSGNMELKMRERMYMLNEGDAVYFSKDVPQCWENNTDKDSRLLWIILR
ncbi:MAG TPA: XRE family transcriptional regulator [Elusimicrobia bacterium]|nr:MAG: hypothetical protein A2278_08555 [Elusimicrobia bacterium RIFOXYA12_FULL_49_49]OGS07783.1 MAG: hypothetical protein A2204_03055 [Elusimicrobia bacterium RIFOXYA1_FULL_47_7]OGS10387.1 MAG: hypothetical protein A2386_05545 [Elusimicrobia bacterium RIFOXYB1_FULL_48_9]OGS14821.1 MAG: hypothetical protein A2251_10040 [Elusimicrobia bacterium RIFOXYA2_FULL_47_53]OGS25529.1 MAG: hypothetical protein A2339_05555 [Elusimicrobia bacterium RIFOXYB12_FULL_50_12]OGS28895.1 MAG: hypothetical protein